MSSSVTEICSNPNMRICLYVCDMMLVRGRSKWMYSHTVGRTVYFLWTGMERENQTN